MYLDVWYIFRQNFESRAVRNLNGSRKGILDPKRLVRCVVDEIDIAGMSDGDGDVFTPAPDRTKSGRIAFKNESTRRFGSKYRDADNTEKLMGELMPLGKAFGIIAVCMFGPCLPTEKALHADRLEIWKNPRRNTGSDAESEKVDKVRSALGVCYKPESHYAIWHMR